jgi:hypothetical protein
MLQPVSREFNPKLGRLYSTKRTCGQCGGSLVKQRFRVEVARRRGYDYHLWCTGCSWNSRTSEKASRATWTVRRPKPAY